jgi:hypothetical protein
MLFQFSGLFIQPILSGIRPALQAIIKTLCATDYTFSRGIL